MADDTTDKDRIFALEKENACLRDALKACEAAKRDALMRFAAGFSHDVNNFLTPVLAYSTMMKEDLPAGHPAVEYAQEILEAGERAQHLIKLIQDIRAKGQFSGVMSLNEAVAAAVADFRARVPANITLVTHMDTDIPAVRGDSAAMRRALKDIFDNAVNAMPVGGDLTVTTRVETLDEPILVDGESIPAGRYAVVSVRDQGTGISDEVRPRIYDPYFTTKPQGQAKGLGLSIAHGLIRKCNGYVRCTSAVGAGTTIDIFLTLQA